MKNQISAFISKLGTKFSYFILKIQLYLNILHISEIL